MPLSQPPEGLTAPLSGSRFKGILKDTYAVRVRFNKSPKEKGLSIDPVIPQEADPDYFP